MVWGHHSGLGRPAPPGRLLRCVRPEIGVRPITSLPLTRLPGDAVLHEPHVVGLALLACLAAADGDEQAALLARVGDVPLLELDGFRTPQPAHEEQPDDDAVDGPALGRELRGLPTSASGRPARRWPPGFAAEQGAA